MKTIGLIICDITNAFSMDILKNIENYASKNDFSIVLYNSDYEPKEELKYMKIFIKKS